VISGKTLEPKDLLNILRRWPVIVIPFVLIAVAGAAVVRKLPNKYRSETLIMVVPQRVPESYVRSTVTTRIEDRLRSINQQITSRTRLEPVIKEFNLYADEVRTGLMEDVVEHMRRDITTDIIRGDAFRISYVSNDPRTAMKVTERLASMYIDESLRDREVLADSTNQFLDSQLVAAKERLVEHEKKLEAYKMRYSGQLPGQVQANLQVMQNAQLQIQSLVDSLNRDRDRRLVVQGQLADLGADPSTVLAAADEPSTPAVSQAAAELASARKTLDQLLLRLKESHPDVVRQQRLVSELQKKVADEAATQALVPQEKGRNNADPVEMARLNRVEQIRTELDGLNRQIAQKEQEEERLRALVRQYQARVESAPALESELTELMRDYDTLERAYTGLLAKKEEAQVSANLERHQIGEQFKILDPARMPEKPFSPNRPMLYSACTAAGLGLGLLLAGFLEYRDTSLKTEEDVVAVLTLPVLAMIPELRGPRRHGLLRRRRA
jgi:polysaccharide chain length determinant protein (PEP-CTERM system associated)